MNAAAVELTVEELHFLAAAHGLSAVPGLGPLPGDEASLALLAGTAARSLLGRGLGIYDASGEFLMASELIPLFDVFEDPEWVIAAARVSVEGERGARTWTASGSSVTELVQLAPGAYALLGLSLEDVPAEVGEFLELGGEDDGVGEPEELDESRVGFLAEASRVNRLGEGAEGVALEWVDPGDGGRVLVFEDSFVVATGRARVLAQLV